jgi:NAD(P)-dependent dehydrogenase (short-subunit alcohol dehydrogenase family)
VARALAEAGAKVSLFDMNAEGTAAVAEEIGALALPCDVTSADSVTEAFAAAQARHGPVSICVNCAGIGTGALIVGRDGPHDLDLFRRTLDVNLVGTFNVLRLAAAEMAELAPTAEGERGVIVNTSSIAAYEGLPGQTAYAAAKAGVAALSIVAARELARHGIRVASIAPGLFATPMFLNLPDKAKAVMQAGLVFPPDPGPPEDFAAMALQIISNRMVNGSNIRLDGALRLGS